MGLVYNADYDEVVVSFDPVNLGILYIKARKSGSGAEQGTLDRVGYKDGVVLPGIYHPTEPSIATCLSGIKSRFSALDALGSSYSDAPSDLLGIDLIYKFGEGNEVNAYHIEKNSDYSHLRGFLALDPLYNSLGRSGGVGTSVASAYEICGRLRPRSKS